MALDKLVDSSQLDSDLTSVANAIRTKGGTSAALAFPAGFVSAIGDISGGDDFFDMSKPAGAIASDVRSIPAYAINGRTGITSISLPNLVEIPSDAFAGCTSVQHIDVGNARINSSCQRICKGCSSLQGFVLKPTSNQNRVLYMDCFRGCSSLAYVDLMCIGLNQSQGFDGCSQLTTIILRYTSALVTLGNVNWFNNTPFASGRTGGTIYIPKSLYDHLGDNTSSDYKAATNWSTINGYGTITWAKIEGSYYETHYADGTEISTS